MDTELLLKDIGLTDKEAKTYLAILELGSSTIKPIALRAGVKRTSIYNFIDHLVELGLISQAEIRGRTHYKAEPPEKLLDIQNRRLRTLEHSMPQFLSLYNDMGSKPRISYFEGPEQVRNLANEGLNCKDEILYIWPGPELTEITGGKRFWNEFSLRRIEKNIGVKLVRFQGKDSLWDASASGLEYLRETRWAPKELENTVDMGVAIYDNGKVGLFAPDRDSYGILIESQSYERTMRMLFNFLWIASKAAKPGEG